MVSILMPAYNAERYVARAVESALAQTWPEKEIIVVDDGSTDRTLEVVQSLQRPGLRVLHQANAGQCAAANRALAAARGELIKFFDADDVLAPDCIARQVERLGDRRDAVASAEWARFAGDPTEGRFDPEPVWRDLHPVDWLVTAWARARPMMQCALWLIPAAVLERAGGWDERLSLINDFEFFTRVLVHAAEVRFTPGARLYYRSGIPGSLSAQAHREAVESAFLSITLGVAHLLGAEESSRTRLAGANVLQDFVYTYYPHHPDLLARAAERIHQLGGSDLAPTGPPGFEILRRVIGWKLARRVERAAVGWGLNRASLRTRVARGFGVARERRAASTL